MSSVLFPRGFLDSPDIPALVSLSTEQKYVWSMCILEADAAGVVFFSPTFCSKIGLVQSVARQIACELRDRGLVVFDEKTHELFICHWFNWQKTPQGQDKWSRQVTISMNKVKSPDVKNSIHSAIENAPPERMGVVPVPLNLLSKLRHPTQGKRWAAAPSLLMLALYTWPTMGPAGICVADYEALSTYISACGPEQIIGHFLDLDRAGNVFFDYQTGEVFYPTRLQSANPAWHMEEIVATRPEIVSHRLKLNFSRLFTRSFGKFPEKSKACVLVDSSLVNKSNSSSKAAASSSFDIPKTPASETSIVITLNARIDELTREGAKKADCNIEKQRADAQRLRDYGTYLGEEVVLKTIASATFLSVAVKMCKQAGCDEQVERIKKKEKEAEAKGDQAQPQQAAKHPPLLRNEIKNRLADCFSAISKVKAA